MLTAPYDVPGDTRGSRGTALRYEGRKPGVLRYRVFVLVIIGAPRALQDYVEFSPD
jgi:hypothetical protein